jgi:hypothetical protein
VAGTLEDGAAPFGYGCPATPNEFPAQAAVFQMTLAAPGNVTLNVAGIDAFLYILNQCGPTGPDINPIIEACGSNVGQVALAAGTYYVVVEAAGGGGGNFTITRQ